jgi:hypothetical protein
MRSALDSTGRRVPRTKPTCLIHTWRPHQQRHFALVLHLHQYQSSRNMHLQYLAKNQSKQRCQSLITLGSDHPPVLEPHMVLIGEELGTCTPDAPGPLGAWSIWAWSLIRSSSIPPGLALIGSTSITLGEANVSTSPRIPLLPPHHRVVESPPFHR